MGIGNYIWKELSKVKGGKVELLQNKVWKKDLGLGDDEVRVKWNDYFGDLYNIETQEQVTVHMCGLDGVQRGSYFGGELE